MAEDEKLYIKWEVEKILKRYAAGEREFLYIDLTNARLSGASWDFNGKNTIFNNTILPDGTIRSELY